MLDGLSTPKAFAIAVECLVPTHHRILKDALPFLQQLINTALPMAGSPSEEGAPSDVRPCPLDLLFNPQRILTGSDDAQVARLLGDGIIAHLLDYSELSILAGFVAGRAKQEHPSVAHWLLHEATMCIHDMMEYSEPLQVANVPSATPADITL